MTHPEKLENAHLSAAGRIPADTLLYLTSKKNKHQKIAALPIHTASLGLLMASVIELSSKGFLSLKPAKLLVGACALVFMIRAFYFCQNSHT